ncbi:MAG: hypothetical protein EOO15_10550 [Chitinophagaceae bacterium]|nr:MAG: hypothetical protein EOO15_10550 [Chitinophagaceae bacterium]
MVERTAAPGCLSRIHHRATTLNGGTGTVAKSSSIGLSPFVGVFVRENLLAGVSATYRKVSSKHEPSFEETVTNTGGGLLLRRYFRLGGTFYFYVNGGLDYVHGTRSSTTSGTSTLHTNSGSLSVSPGVAFVLGKRIVLETSLSNFLALNYEQERSRFASGDEYKRNRFAGGFGVGGSMPLNIGFNIMLGK